MLCMHMYLQTDLAIGAFFPNRQNVSNIMKMCLSLKPPENNILLKPLHDALYQQEVRFLSFYFYSTISLYRCI